MSKLRLTGSTSGYSEIQAPAVAGDQTFTLPGTGGVIRAEGSTLTLGTAQTASGTSIPFTGIPSWVKRITVMLAGISTSGTNHLLVQLGDAGGIETSGYNSTSLYSSGSGTNHGSSTSGFMFQGYTASDVKSGVLQLVTLGSNIWVASGWLKIATTQATSVMGDKTLSATLDRIQLTTVGGTDTFDAGTVNIMYEG